MDTEITKEIIKCPLTIFTIPFLLPFPCGHNIQLSIQQHYNGGTRV